MQEREQSFLRRNSEVGEVLSGKGAAVYRICLYLYLAQKGGVYTTIIVVRAHLKTSFLSEDSSFPV